MLNNNLIIYFKIYKFKIILKLLNFIKKKIYKCFFLLKFNNSSFQDIIKKSKNFYIRENIKWLCPNNLSLLNDQELEKIKLDYIATKNYLNNYEIEYNYKNFSFFDSIKVNFDYRGDWEFDRFHFFLPLTKYFLITKNKESISIAYEILTNHFNKSKYGHNLVWVDGLQLSIRVYSISYFYFNCKDFLSEKKKEYILKILKFHELPLKEQMTPLFEIKNNHVIGELCGLIILNIIFGLDKKIKNYYHLLILNLSKITYKDGLLYEGSIGYNRFVLDFLNFTYILLNQNNFNKVNLSLIKRHIYEMSFNLLKLTDRNGHLPELGDVDYGRLFKADEENYFCINETLKVSSKILSIKLHNDDKIKGLDFWLSGNFKSDKSKLKSYFINNIEKLSSNILVYNKSELQIYFEFSPTGLGEDGYGGHGHNDMGSQIIRYKGEYILDDLGNPSYFNQKKSLRNYYRSSRVHNTVSRIKEEHSRFLGKYLISPTTHSNYLKYKILKFKNYIILGKFQSNNKEDTIIRRSLIIEKKDFIKIYNLDKYNSKKAMLPQLSLILPIKSKLKKNEINIENRIIINFDKNLTISQKKTFKYISSDKRIPVYRYTITNFKKSYNAHWSIIIKK